MSARASGKAETALAAAALVLLGVGAHLLHGIHGLRRDTARVERTVVAAIVALRETAARANDARYEAATVLAAGLDAAPVETATAARAAQAETQRYAEFLLGRAARERRHQLEWVDEELARGGASVVETDLDRVAADLEALKGTAAANRAQLAALRASTERRIVEFRIRKSAQPAQVAGIGVLLRTADPKRNRYSVDLIADGLRTEQRDRTLQEPVRFYASRSRIPCELVVNEIGQDEVAGYLAMPAATELARGYSSGSAETRNLPGR